MKTSIAPMILSEYAEAHDQIASTSIFIPAPPLYIRIKTSLHANISGNLQKTTATGSQNTLFSFLCDSVLLQQNGLKSAVGQVCLPAYPEAAVAVGADEIDVGFSGIGCDLERDMESVGITAARAGIYLTFRPDFFYLGPGSHFHKGLSSCF